MEFKDKLIYRHSKGIYCIENIITHEKYIGKTEDTFLHRFNNHMRALCNDTNNKKLQDSWNKYGDNSFIFYVIHAYQDGDDLNDLEIKFIREYDTVNNGFNSMKGGQGKKATSYTKEKMSRNSKRIKLSSERIAALAEARKHAYTEDSRIKMRNSKLYGNHPRSVLNKETVIKAKELFMDGKTIKEVSELLNIKYHNAKTIYHNKCWEYIEVPGYDEYLKSRKPNKAKALSREEVINVRTLIKQGFTASQINKLTGISVNAIYNIKSGKAYFNIN